MENQVLISILILSIVSESIAGALSAGRKGMDPFGVVIIAFATALGGGTLRDVFLDNFPLLWIRWPEVIWICLAAALTTILIRRYLNHLLRVFLFFDAVGVTGLSIIGAHIALDHGHGYTIATLSALLTGVFGGIIRDVLCGDVPWVFRKELYATVSLLATGLYVSLTHTALDPLVIIAIVMVFGVTLRMLALKYHITLPIFLYDGPSSD
ncbi:trimeric intracellular cation channel family protein [Kistimonas scapharcae]|uniref:Trimeric intracellular cation channel family protein n=1 Tax=Kistimonas scapharcae TaxID=1036133 RepID=A0ABP8V6T8_9GAMM